MSQDRAQGAEQPDVSDDKPARSVRQRAILVYAQIAEGLYIALGVIGLLFTGAEFSADGTDLLGFFTIQAVGAVVYLAVGMLGPAMTTTSSRARLYLIVLAALFIPWAVLGVALKGSPSDLFTGNVFVVATHLVTGVVAVAVVLWADRERPAPAI